MIEFKDGFYSEGNAVRKKLSHLALRKIENQGLAKPARNHQLLQTTPQKSRAIPRAKESRLRLAIRFDRVTRWE